MCFGVQRLLGDQPRYQQLVLPFAQLAWMLLQYEQQAAEAERSSSSGSSSSSRDASLSIQQLGGGIPGAVLEFTREFGYDVYAGLHTFRCTSSSTSSAEER
jgi:hypothetical protein